MNTVLSNGIEEWKAIDGFEYYEVSNFGRVRSMDRFVKNKNGIYRRIAGRILKLRDNKEGYDQVDLYRDGKRITMKVHRLVAIAFLPNPNNLPVVNHINSIRNDNRVDNLEWVTVSENNIHAYIYGRRRNKHKKIRIA